ncbi:MAG: FtsL-like putative cell division protein [Cyclobacteriaceae bacterium]|nr:FtsL-like putative cell division protein [Cyclobacteriaceae bacterium]
MAENRFITDKKKEKGRSLFSRLERYLGMQALEEGGIPVRYLPKILFVFLLALIYIWNTHTSEKSVRKISALEKEVEDLRADYTTLKAEYMLSGKQSEVAKKVAKIGVKESLNPPNKIVVEN